MVCSGCTDEKQSKDNNGITETKSFLTNSELKGHWKVVDAVIVDKVSFLDIPTPVPDENTKVYLDSPWDAYQAFDLVFEDDSMYAVDYPVEAFDRYSFTVDSVYLHTNLEGTKISRPIELVNDTLYIYTPMQSDPGYFKESFIRTSFNDSVLSVMKEYGVNYPALSGTWILEREYDYDHGNHYELKFPYDLPDSIEISRDQMMKFLDQDKTYMIITDGKPREYTVNYKSWYLHFSPGDWYNGEDPWIHFRSAGTDY